mgnify:CR=1 FL=1
MSPRTKAIIIIAGALILFGLLVSVLFDVFPGKEEREAPEETPVVLPDRDEGLPRGAVFDASNADEFAAVNPGRASAASGTLEQEAQELAAFFVERFGTYSSDSGFAYLSDLAGFMTSRMREETELFERQSPDHAGFYAVTAELASIETDAFSPSSRSARFSAVLSRTETQGGSSSAYQQDAVIELTQSGSGEWLVDSVLWGSKR